MGKVLDNGHFNCDSGIPQTHIHRDVAVDMRGSLLRAPQLGCAGHNEVHCNYRHEGIGVYERDGCVMHEMSSRPWL